MNDRTSVVVLGIFAANTTYKAQRLPRIAETILGSSFSLGPGGKGSNQAIAAAKAGAKVTFISRVGNDRFGEMAIAAHEAAGVVPRIMMMDDFQTGAAFVFVDEVSGDNAIIVAPGASAQIGESDLIVNLADIENASIFLTQLEQPISAALHGLRLARAAGVTTILNPSPAQELPGEIYGLCDFLVPNEIEAAELTGVPIQTDADACAAGDILLARGARAVIITLGSRGALYHSSDRSTVVPAMTYGAVVDTSGAGDAFLGGFACALAGGQTPEDAVRFGCATAAIAVTRPGTASGMPTGDEVDAFLRSHSVNVQI